jgi:hypothetical protein
LDCFQNNEEIALSKYEDELDTMINENLIHGQDLHTQKLFIAFQNAATNVTKMFRGEKIKSIKNIHYYFIILERSGGTNNWNTFHTAAESVTMLYKGKYFYFKISLKFLFRKS